MIYTQTNRDTDTHTLKPTSFYSQCHTFLLHRAGCRRCPCILGGTDTSHSLRHSCCVWGYIYNSGHSWFPTCQACTRTHHCADYMGTGYSRTGLYTSSPSAPCGTDTCLSAGHSWGLQTHRYHTGTVWHRLNLNSWCRRCSFRGWGGSARAGNTCRFACIVGPSGVGGRCTRQWLDDSAR